MKILFYPCTVFNEIELGCGGHELVFTQGYHKLGPNKSAIMRKSPNDKELLLERDLGC